MDDDTLEHLRTLDPRKAYETVKHSVLRNPWGASSEDLKAAVDQMVAAGILTWDEVESFEQS
jgi:hypothetical protein